MQQFAEIIDIVLTLLLFAIFARAILSWFPIDRDGPIVKALESITDPILEPLRRVVPTIGAIDITPMVAILLLAVLSSFVRQSVQ